ncbi:MAG TPA: hypothetical protein VK978_03325 [Candidatus Saccharimonadales bacterium]|nr:hypothetical protein [Candidatus Saccharimonadales bacterium]
MAQLNQRGVAHLALVFVILFFAVAGFAGYKIMAGNKPAVSETAASTSAEQAGGAITSQADVAAAEERLNSAQDIDSGLDASSLDADVNDML